MRSKGFIIGEHDVSQQLLGLGGAAIGLSVCPDGGGQELLALHLGVAISSKYCKVETLHQPERELGMSADVSGVVFSATVHESHGVVDLVTIGKSIISAVGSAVVMRCIHSPGAEKIFVNRLSCRPAYFRSS